MNTLECFAAHETLNDINPPLDSEAYAAIRRIQEALAGPQPQDSLMALLEWEAQWRAKLRFIRAKAMVEEAERIRATESTRQPDGLQKARAQIANIEHKMQ